jgi:leucyl aminopeptidase
VVVIGAHLDSVGASASGRAPGADDDGSGIASIFEIFRVLVNANYRPDYTIQFMAYAAEEAGLLGSQAIATSYAKDKIDVYAVLQLDMTGYSRDEIGIITDHTSPELNAFVRTLVNTYTTLKWKNSVCGYGCSDHASWTRTGVRASFPFETPFGSHNPNIHSSRDTLDHLSQEQMLQFVYLGLGFAVELAGVAPQ